LTQSWVKTAQNFVKEIKPNSLYSLLTGLHDGIIIHLGRYFVTKFKIILAGSVLLAAG